MGSKQWVRSLRMKKRSADDPDGEIQYRELRTLSQVWADFDTESLALQESDPVAAKKEGWSGRTQRFFNIQWHLLMHLRYGRGHGSDSRYLPKPLNYRLDKRASSCNWQQDLDRRLGLLNLATALPCYRKSKFEIHAYTNAIKSEVKEALGIELPVVPNLAPGMTVLMLWKEQWIVGNIMTLFRATAKSFPSYLPLDMDNTGKARVSVLRAAPKLKYASILLVFLPLISLGPPGSS
jgi:hypothetical protein